MKIKGTIILAFVCLFHTAAFAQQTNEASTTPSPIRLLYGGGLEFGGDDVVEVLFTDGDSQTITAGQGGYVEVGAELQLPQLKWFLLRGSIGFKYVTTEADNAHIRLTRVPLTVSGNVMVTDDIRLGLGFVKHANVRLKTDGLGEDEKFEAQAGPRFEIAYKWIGLTYTIQEYTNDNETYNANAFGVSFTGVFPTR